MLIEAIKEGILAWGWIAATLLSGFIGWVVWTAKKSFVTQDEHKAHDERIRSVETGLGLRPTFEDFRKHESMIAESTAALRETTATLGGVQQLMRQQSKQLEMLIEHELRREK